MKFHQNFILSILLFALLFAIFELKSVVFATDAVSWIINKAAVSDLYFNELTINSAFMATDKWPSWALVVTRLLLMLIIAIIITRTSVKNMLFNERSYLPIVILPSIAMGIFSSEGSILMLTLSLLQIVIFSLLFEGFRRSNSIKEFFYASIFAAISTIIYPPASVSLITILLSVAVLNRGGRELFCAIIGFLIPLFLYSYLQWIFNDSFTLVLEKFWLSIITPASVEPNQWLDLSNRIGLSILIVSLLPMMVATLLAIATYHYQLRYARRRQRKFYNLLIFQLLAVTTISISVPGCSLYTLQLNIVPLTMILSCYFHWNNYKFSKLLYLSLPIGVFIYNIAYIFIQN